MWALLPLKEFHFAKQRLSNVLTCDERIALFTAMVSDVLSTLTCHPEIENTLIISNDRRALQLANRFGVCIMPELNSGIDGLNMAVEIGVQRLARWGIDEVLVVHGDLPLMSLADLNQLIASHSSLQQPCLSIATDIHRRGSNAVLCTAASTMEFRYGPDSLNAHIRVAYQKEFQLQVMTLSSIAHDIDTIEDLVFLHQQAASEYGRFSYHFLHSLGLNQRLRSIRQDSNHFPDFDYHLVS